MGVLGGAVDENRGPHLTSALLIPPSERLRCTDFDPGPHRPAAVALPSVRRFLTVRTCVLGPVLKSSPSVWMGRIGGFSYRSGGPTLFAVARDAVDIHGAGQKEQAVIAARGHRARGRLLRRLAAGSVPVWAFALPAGDGRLFAH